MRKNMNKIIVLVKPKRMTREEMQNLVGDDGGILIVKDEIRGEYNSIKSAVVIAHLLYPYTVQEVERLYKQYSGYSSMSFKAIAPENEIGGLF